MTEHKCSKPIRVERRMRYCSAGCNNRPVEHEYLLYPGFWRVRCTECLAERTIQSTLGLSDDLENVELWQRPEKVVVSKHRGSAAEFSLFLQYVESGKVRLSPGDTFTADWLKEVLGLGPKQVWPSDVARLLRKRGYAEKAGDSGVYRWKGAVCRFTI